MGEMQLSRVNATFSMEFDREIRAFGSAGFVSDACDFERGDLLAACQGRQIRIQGLIER